MKVKDYIKIYIEDFKSLDSERIANALKEIHESFIREANAKIRAYYSQKGVNADPKYSDTIIHQYNNKANALNQEIERIVGVPVIKDDWFIKSTKRGLDDE